MGAPDVRSLAVATDGTIYANIHVGWLARFRDAEGELGESCKKVWK